jgi:hypothetical protein
VEVVGGKPKVLTETPGGFIPNRWYRLDAATCEGNVTCSIDGAPVLRCHTDRFGLGSPGLYSEGPDGSFFDDVLIEDYESFQEDFATLARWEVVGGDWSLAGRGRAKCASGGLLASGRREWDNYRCECEVTADRGGVGLDVARQADGAAMRLRLGFPGSAYAGKAQLVSVSGAGEKVLAEAAVRAAAGTAHRLAATVEGGFVRGYVDGNQVLEAVDAGLKGGAIGLSADRPNGALFADVGVRFLRPNRPARVVREFSKTSEHNEMRGWAGPRAPWVEPPTIEPGTVWWTKGDYFGDATVTFMLRFVGLRDGSVRVTLNGSPDDEQVGAHLILTAARDSRVLKARVVDGTKPLGEGQVELSGSSCRVEFSRRGRELLLLIDGRPLALKGA